MDKKTGFLAKIKAWLGKLSFKTGVICLIICGLCYGISFWQFAWDYGNEVIKGAVWATFFGLAKTFQYSGLAILGVEGWNRIKSWFKKSKNQEESVN